MREELSKAIRYQALIKTKRETLNILRDRQRYISPQIKDKVDSGKDNSTQTAAERILFLENQIEKDICVYTEQLNRIYALISSVQDEQLQEILELRYIQALTMQQIADKKGYTVRQVRRKLRRGENLIKDVL